MKRNDVLSLLDKKRRGIDDTSFNRLSEITMYSSRHLKRLYKKLEEEGIKETKIHKNRGFIPSNKAPKSEIEYIVRFKSQYPIITIAQFKDIYEEDIVTNPEKINVVKRNKLQIRSYSFYQSLFKLYKWKSPVKHKTIKDSDRPSHPLRKPSERLGHMVQIDGTPFDWLHTGQMHCLHLAVDDATSTVLAGWFTLNECTYGYCQIMRLILIKYGIPYSIYSDRHTIFKGLDNNLSIFGTLMKELGIHMIYAGSPQAKGRIERYNGTCQRRLINDIKRNNIKSYDELNTWFNNSYCNYLNTKFSFNPIDPNSEFVEIDKHFNFNNFFSIRFERTIDSNSIFSVKSINYCPIDKNGEVVYIRKGVKIDVRYEILTNTMTIKRFGVIYKCKPLGPSGKGRRKNVVDNSKDLISLMNSLDKKKTK